MTHVHFIGIGGTGLSAIARVLLEEGYTVSGSDRTGSPLFNAITAAGALTFLGHDASQINGADLVIRSSAVSDDNPEVTAALDAGIPVMKRSEFLAELTQGKDTLAVAGSHGKTTTTAMLIWVLTQLGTDPSFIAGGVVNQLGTNARAGSGQYFAIEADEYDNMFLGLAPKIAVVTNIEHDHPDCFPTREDYRAAFKAFLRKVRPDGLALVCWDDAGARSLAEECASEIAILGYGSSPEATYKAVDIRVENGLPVFSFCRNDLLLGEVRLSIPGRHNVINATAALAVVHQLGLDLKAAVRALGAFTGAGRRFEILGTGNGVTVIDDYGHHPTELAATLQAAKSRYSGRRVWAVWQPHTFTRTRTLESDFIRALSTADMAVVLKIYAAREADPGYSAARIAEAMPKEKAMYCESFDAASAFLLEKLLPGDVMIVFSAGDATEVSQAVLNGLRQRERED
ncbi:MAG TPA: UDP-N-acetylmuramate--L-alanine ligase [Anaerolineaceae bacterium]|nr:UDP-N-acetylmuramate--L-alanine ligase [Anaerolineaceae bacterium]